MMRVALARASQEAAFSSVYRTVFTSSTAVCSQRKNFSHVVPAPQSKVSTVITPTPLRSLAFQAKCFHSGQPLRGESAWFSPKDDITFWGKTLTRLGFTGIPKSVLKHSGYLIYMKVADEMNYLKFFEHCSLPDTYASWFIVLELHVWILAARLMQDGKEGRLVRNALINAMWDDNNLRSKKLEGALPSARRRDLQRLHEQFHAAMIAYDEGLKGDDYILAGALWRRFLRTSESEPAIPPKLDSASHEKVVKQVKSLEMLVLYVRSQYHAMNSLSREQLIHRRAVKWAPFDDSLFLLANKMERSSGSNREALKMR